MIDATVEATIERQCTTINNKTSKINVQVKSLAVLLLLLCWMLGSVSWSVAVLSVVVSYTKREDLAWSAMNRIQARINQPTS